MFCYSDTPSWVLMVHHSGYSSLWASWSSYEFSRLYPCCYYTPGKNRFRVEILLFSCAVAELGCFVAPCRRLFFKILFPEHQSARKAPVDVAIIFPFKKAAESSPVASVKPRHVQLFLYICIFALTEPALMPGNMLSCPPHPQ